MPSMRFDVKCVKDCLVNNGRVFTVRSWDGYAQESLVDVDDVGKCKKIRIAKISHKDDIARYVKLSGFNNVDEWWNKILSFGASSGYLFLVVKVQGGKL
jgi:hypothetical protein